MARPKATMDVVGRLIKTGGPDEVQNVNGPMTPNAARHFAERLRQLGYSVRVIKHRKET